MKTFLEELKKEFSGVEDDARYAANETARITQCSAHERAIFWKYLNTMAGGKPSKEEMIESSVLLVNNLKYL